MIQESKYTGCMVGLAVGDALGYPPEFRTLAQIRTILGPQGVQDFLPVQGDIWTLGPIIIGEAHPPGTYTDDTQMSLAIARALLNEGDGTLEALMSEISREFVAWMESPENNRAPGATCSAGCDNLKAGVPWREAGVADSKGCGSAMRTAPIGLRYVHDLDRLEEVARASSLPTHGHDAALEGAVGTALLVALALRGEPPEAMYEELMRRTHGRSVDFSRCLKKVPGLLDQPPEWVLSSSPDGRTLGESWIAEEAVASALYCFWRSPRDYRKVVLTAANTDGDSDSIACIAGAICGAFVGLEEIPEKWVQEVENTEYLQLIGHQLYLQANPQPLPSSEFDISAFLAKSRD